MVSVGSIFEALINDPEIEYVWQAKKNVNLHELSKTLAEGEMKAEVEIAKLFKEGNIAFVPSASHTLPAYQLRVPPFIIYILA